MCPKVSVAEADLLAIRRKGSYKAPEMCRCSRMEAEKLIENSIINILDSMLTGRFQRGKVIWMWIGCIPE